MMYNKIQRKEILRRAIVKNASMNKRAGGLLDAATSALPGALWILGATAVAATAGAGIAAGYSLGKITEPGEYDMENLQKEQILSRLKRDNQTQRVQAQRQQAQRQMRQGTKKPVRIFG